MERIDLFIDKNVSPEIIFQYYLFFIPEIIYLVLPVAMLLASLFCITQLVKHNEISALKSSGISLHRIIISIVFFSVIISCLSLYFNETIVPAASRKKYDLYRIYIKNMPPEVAKKRSNIYIQDSPSRFITIGYYDGNIDVGYNVDIQTLSGSMIRERITAKEIHWQGSEWTTYNGIKRVFEEEKEVTQRFDQETITFLNIKPQDLEGLPLEPEEMNYRELGKYIQRLRDLGGDTRLWTIMRNQKLAFPFSNFIIVLFGLAYASRKLRGGAAAGVALSFLICFIYYGLNISVAPVLGEKGIFHPIMAAWMTNALFTVFGIITFIKTPQ